MMTKPRKLGNFRLARLARYLVGTQMLVLRFDHQEYGDTVRIVVDSDWAGSEERGFVGCIRSSASIEFRRSRTVRNRGCLGTRNLHNALYEEKGRTINIDVETDSTACDRDVFPNGCWKRPGTFEFVGSGSKTPFVTRSCV